VVEEIRSAGGEVIAQPCDITDVAQVESLVRKTEETFGRIDILVNNAALFAKLQLKPFTGITSDEWDLVIKINTRGVFEYVKAVTPIMRRQKYGKIVNITSSGVMKGIPMFATWRWCGVS
jgi:NAD(P)-dependent dehydrogenase (short-subunit alcohol dehydrogenase family)